MFYAEIVAPSASPVKAADRSTSHSAILSLVDKISDAGYHFLATARGKQTVMIIQHGQVALPGKNHSQALDIRIANGQIAELGAHLAGDASILDASGWIVLPGGIDPHVHFDTPGYTEREEFYHGSCAAASGSSLSSRR